MVGDLPVNETWSPFWFDAREFSSIYFLAFLNRDQGLQWIAL